MIYSDKCPRGGTGIRATLRTWSRKGQRFKSSRGHNSRAAKKPYGKGLFCLTFLSFMIYSGADCGNPAATDLLNTRSATMKMFWIISGMAAIVVLTIVIILLLANLGAYFTKIAQGTTV